MIIYYLFIGILATAILITKTRDRISVYSTVLFYIVCIVFTGLRDRVGTDWSNYSWKLDASVGIDYLTALTSNDPGFSSLLVLSNQTGGGIYALNLIAASIFFLGIFSVARKQHNFWLSVLAVTPYLIIVIGMSATRQSIAIGLILILFSRWEKSSYLEKISTILVASSVHNSAIIFLALVAYKSDLRLMYKIVLSTVLISIGLYLSIRSGSQDVYTRHYVTDTSGIFHSPGALFHIMLVALPATLYLLFKKRFVNIVENPDLLNTLSICALLLMAIGIFYSTGADRISLYFYYVPMVVMSNITAIINNKSFYKLGVIVASFMIVFLWLEYGNNSYAWRSYENILF